MADPRQAGGGGHAGGARRGVGRGAGPGGGQRGARSSPGRGRSSPRPVAGWEPAEAFATCPPGLEDVLAAELGALNATGVSPVRGGVSFAADRRLVERANLELRSALRVLVPLARGPAGNADELYRLARAVDWATHLDAEHTLAVQAHVHETPGLTHAVYAAQVVKDAIVDLLRERFGRRPDVDLDDPDLPVVLHLHRGIATVSLDSSGRSLHRRGYRDVQVRSPLNEALAAGIVLATGWDGGSPLLDPMCGSATLPIEAALLATRTAPGLLDPRFAFQRWPGFDARGWERLLAETRARVVRPPAGCAIAGADAHAGALGIARRSVAQAGLAGLVRLRHAPLARHRPEPRPALVVVNPPYGERLGEEEELAGVYRELGAFLRDQCPGATAYVLSGNPRLTRHLGLKSSGRRVLFNGPIECRLLRYEIRA